MIFFEIVFVFCKYIIFFLAVVLDVSQEILKESRYIGDDDLTIIFSKKISHSFLLPPKNVLRKNKHDLKEILQKHQGYDKPQETTYHHKESRSAKCQGRGFFCPRKQFLANPPHWSNVKYSHFLVPSGSIPDSIIADTSYALGIPIVKV